MVVHQNEMWIKISYGNQLICKLLKIIKIEHLLTHIYMYEGAVLMDFDKVLKAQKCLSFFTESRSKVTYLIRSTYFCFLISTL